MKVVTTGPDDFDGVKCDNDRMSDPKQKSIALPLLVIAGTAATIAVNWLAAAGLVNGVTPDAVSDRYQTILTPAGYAFAIWSVIYAGLIAFSIYQILPSVRDRYPGVRQLYLATCVLNCIWILLWHHYMVAACLAVIAALAAVLVIIVARLSDRDSLAGALMTKAVFGIYAGWVTCATLVNMSIALVDQGFEIGPTAWVVIGVVSILLAGGAAVAVRLKFNNYLYPIAVAWAVTAIAVKQSGNTPIVVAAAVAAVTGLITAGSVVTKLRDSSSEADRG